MVLLPRHQGQTWQGSPILWAHKPNFVARLQGRLDSLAFVEVDETQKIVQTNDEESIVIQPRAFNLGHQDVSHAMSSHNAVGEWIQMRRHYPKSWCCCRHQRMQDGRLGCCSSAISLYLEYSARALDKRCRHAERDDLRDCSLNRNGIVTAHYDLVDVARLEPNERVPIQCKRMISDRRQLSLHSKGKLRVI